MVLWGGQIIIIKCQWRGVTGNENARKIVGNQNREKKNGTIEWDAIKREGRGG